MLTTCAGAKVIALSLYAWNTKLSLAFAEAYKKAYPESFIIVGGPSVPDVSEYFLRTNSFVDIALHNEGEIAFAKLLETIVSTKNFFDVPSASFIHENIYYKNNHAPRIQDLSDIVSPFLSGSMDNLIRQNNNEKWIVTITLC